MGNFSEQQCTSCKFKDSINKRGYKRSYKRGYKKGHCSKGGWFVRTYDEKTFIPGIKKCTEYMKGDKPVKIVKERRINSIRKRSFMQFSGGD